jgi:hypothetical protein
MSVYATVVPHWSFWLVMALCLAAELYIGYELFKGPRK